VLDLSGELLHLRSETVVQVLEHLSIDADADVLHPSEDRHERRLHLVVESAETLRIERLEDRLDEAVDSQSHPSAQQSVVDGPTAEIELAIGSRRPCGELQLGVAG